MKIVVIGETCIDKFIYCKINRLSPEAPVPILQPMYTKQNAGMSGNTMANIKALNPESKLLHFCNLSQVTKTRYVEKKTNHMFLILPYDKIQIYGVGLEKKIDFQNSHLVVR